MTTAPERRSLLPLITTTRHGSRSLATCFYRCGNACDHPEPNTSENGHVQDEIVKALKRRSLLATAAVGGGALVLGGVTGSLSAAAAAPAAGRAKGASDPSDLARTEFTPVPPNVRDAVSVPEGFDTDVVMSWGDPVLPGAPAFDPAAQTVESARAQFGYNCDYVGVIPLDRSSRPGSRALLVVNHEYTNEELMFPAGAYSAEQVRRIAIASHGMSVVEIERGSVPGSWLPVPVAQTTYNRRFHDATEFELTGPAAGDARLRTSADPTGKVALGTFNNCAGGSTPWGTVLSGEENFNQYFESSTGQMPAPAKLSDGSTLANSYSRYGLSANQSRDWHTVDPRFDLSAEPNEPHRFGWIVEVDPLDPTSTPVKHTMLGRFKHEGANVAISQDGYAVAYMGDDERGDYLYKFVSAEKVSKDRTRNKTLLSKGTLYVAKLVGDGAADGQFDGTGEWIRLCTDTRSFVPGFSVADVLIFTRQAADKMAPTKMDRPEDVEPNPVNGKVYAALTNNSNRGNAAMPADEANPVTASHTRPALGAPLVRQSGNRNGYVLEMTPAGNDHASTTFTWDLFLVCGDPSAPETYFAGFDKSQVSPISCPDNVAFDTAGNLWVSTDGNVLGSNDGIFRVPLEGPERGKVQQFATMPRAAEACGPLITDHNRSLFFAAQHPGEDSGSTYENPTSTWPHTDSFPRPSVGVIYKAR